MDLERYQNASYEDLVQDLSAAIKAKVDLLKDLSKASKEYVWLEMIKNLANLPLELSVCVTICLIRSKS